MDRNIRCETCVHWTRSNHPDLEVLGSCDMQLIEVEPAGGSSRWVKGLITRAEHKCMSWEKAPQG